MLRCILLGLLIAVTSAAGAAQPLATQLRRPVALVVSQDASRAYVANQRSGTISIVDLNAKTVLAEQQIGKELSHLVAVPQMNALLATDQGAHELILVGIAAGDQLEVQARLKVSPYPVSIALAPDGKKAFVASLWSRRLCAVELDLATDEPAALKVARQVDLDFPPRQQVLLVKENRLVVADAFTGRLAFFDPGDLSLQVRKEFPGHNIRGLGVSADGQKLLVSHQMLNDLAHTIQNDVHWGMLMSNDLRWLKIESALAGGRELYFGAHMHPLGEPGKGASDPGGLDVAEDGTVVVTLSGVGDIATGKEDDFSLYRIHVGKRPVAVKVSADGKWAFAVNMFDDSLAIVDLAERELASTIPLGPQPKLSQAQQGELLFHEGSLSHDAWMSCQSCHSDGHTSGQLNDNFSDLSFGASKRVLSLLGQKDTAPYAWNAKAPDFVTQIRSSIEKTMQADEPPADETVQALAAYLATLELPRPVDELRGTQDSAAIARGKLVFEKRDCARCHAGPTYTSEATYDVGLKDKEGNKLFNPPSLRGISHRGPFFHDNSAATLEDVFLKHKHPAGGEGETGESSAEEVRDLVRFLESL